MKGLGDLMANKTDTCSALMEIKDAIILVARSLPTIMISLRYIVDIDFLVEKSVKHANILILLLNFH